VRDLSLQVLTPAAQWEHQDSPRCLLSLKEVGSQKVRGLSLSSHPGANITVGNGADDMHQSCLGMMVWVCPGAGVAGDSPSRVNICRQLRPPQRQMAMPTASLELTLPLSARCPSYRRKQSAPKSPENRAEMQKKVKVMLLQIDVPVHTVI
jgi:hypothetical protein